MLPDLLTGEDADFSKYVRAMAETGRAPVRD
jgi:hypothetical protein